MKRIGPWLVLALASIASMSAISRQDDRSGEISSYMAEADLGVIMQRAAIKAGAWEKAQEWRKRSLDGLNKRLPDLMRAAEGHPDLIHALKELHISVANFVVNAWQHQSEPASVIKPHQEALQADYERRVEAVKLEARLAGIVLD